MRVGPLTGIGILITLAGCISIGPILCYADPPRPLPAIDGPEDAALLKSVRGVLLENAGEHELVIVDLPTLSRRKVGLRGRGGRLCGPDDEGRVVYGYGQRVRWRDLSTDHDEVLAYLDESQGFVTNLALAPRGGRVLVSMSRSEAEGRELWLYTIGQAIPRSLGPLAVEDSSWFPDGSHAVVELWVDRADGSWGPYPDELSNDPWTCERVSRIHRWPSLQILDAETGDLRWVAWGRMPRVSPSGRNLLFKLSAEGPLRLRCLDTGAESALDLPGLLKPSHWAQRESGWKSEGLCHGWLSERIVVYDAVGTAGQDPGFVASSGLQGYYPKWTVKAADVRTGAFRTLIPSVDDDLCFTISSAYAGEPVAGSVGR